ncbi:MAG: iron-containing alcohol dehydrogenase [Clostridiales bacterium]|nr:iron-containing alcohol dehydrogenase [Clostridiales bacterium]
MNDFIFDNPTKVYFGKNHISSLSGELLKFGKKALLVYGGGSIKKNGIYAAVTAECEKAGIELFELSGVEPNPRHTTANKGAQICKKENIDVILAVGGGSTIDCAKGIAATAVSDAQDVWQLVKAGKWVENALPIVVVLTNAATGSEADCWAVISNTATNEKLALGGSGILPKAAFENPEYSFSLPVYQTACGSFDIFNHVIDNYYLAGDAEFDMILEFQEAVMRTVVKWAPVAMKNGSDYEARANLMWASTMALNTVLDAGTVHGCACHAMEHELSAYYDITHGHGLAIITPRWLTYILDDKTAPAIYRLGVKVFGVEEGLQPLAGAKKAIDALSDFCFNTLALEPKLSNLNIDSTHFKAMASHACGGSVITGLKNLGANDVEQIYKMCL